MHQFIRAFDVDAEGSLSNNRIFADMHSAEDGVPDGMKVDVEGRVYCTGPGGCWVFDAAGNNLGVIVLPEIPPTAPGAATTTAPCCSPPAPRSTPCV